MEKTASGWKIFDVKHWGISLAANYRTAFGEEVRNHGIDGLITCLPTRTAKPWPGKESRVTPQHSPLRGYYG